MKLFGLEITRAGEKKDLSPPDSRGSWYPLVKEPFAGAWQRNEELSQDNCLAFHAVFACHTLICSDVAKLRVKLVAKSGDVWQETTNPAYSPVLRKPNEFQNRIQFFENWVNSKLARGNTYVLKRRDGRGVVVALYVLNPDRVQPLVSDDGQVFYRLSKDNLSGLENDDGVIVPAREIIHDRFNCLFHPLVGISPLYASALAATHGTNIQRAGSRLAANGVRPGGIIFYPSKIPPEEAKRIQETWQNRYSGPEGMGRIAVLGDNAKFQPLALTGEEAQLIEQLQYTAAIVCSTYHVPPFMIGVGDEPSAGGVQDRTLRYYTQCLQAHIESIEVCLDEGLGMDGVTIGTEFDTENLLRLDSVSQIAMLKDGVSAAIYSPNEARARAPSSLPPVKGGEVPYLQQQNWPISQLAEREPPEAKPTEQMPPEPANDDEEEREAARARSAMLALTVRRKLNARH